MSPWPLSSSFANDTVEKNPRSMRGKEEGGGGEGELPPPTHCVKKIYKYMYNIIYMNQEIIGGTLVEADEAVLQ